MSHLISKKRSLLLVAVLALMIAPGIAYAQDGESGSGSTSQTETSHTETPSGSASTVKMESDDSVKTTTGTEQEGGSHETGRLQQLKTETSGKETEKRSEVAKLKLESVQLKRCEAQEKAITKIMTRIAERGQKQLDLFTIIAERVENFYTEKGKTLSNYDTLVAAVNAKKEAAQTVVSAVASSESTFKCDGDNPHGVVDGFQTSLKQEIAALKEYRTAIKNLITGVKSVQSTEKTDATDGGVQQ